MIFVFLNINEISLQACQKCKLLSYVRNFLLLKAINFTVFRLLSLNSHSSLSVVLVKEKLGHNTNSRWIHNVNKWDMLSCWVVQTFFFLYFFQRKILVLPFKILIAISFESWKSYKSVVWTSVFSILTQSGIFCYFTSFLSCLLSLAKRKFSLLKCLSLEVFVAFNYRITLDCLTPKT